MKTVGIIAEYNPFHNGHAYQLAKARELTGADYAVVVMSGNFVQRGLPAMTDKYSRAEMALWGGADLVLELPVSYATGSAEAFAQGAVSLLDSLGCIDTLCFGSECGDISALLPYARLFEEEPELYTQLLKEYVKQGFSFPAARSRAAEEYRNCTERILPCAASDADCRNLSRLLEEPNNILGIEYCRALLRQKSSIRPVTIERISSGYHDLSLDAELASASAIRHALAENIRLEEVLSQIPDFCRSVLQKVLETSGLMQFDDFSSVLFYRLLSLTREDLETFQDITEDLAARIDNLRFQFTTASAFADLLKTKQVTHTRITRALCHLLLNLKQADLKALRSQNYPTYARVLGFRKSAAPLLSAVKQKGTSPLLVKTADASSVLTSVQTRLFEQDVYAAHVYESARVCRFGTPFTNEYTRSPVILP